MRYAVLIKGQNIVISWGKSREVAVLVKGKIAYHYLKKSRRDGHGWTQSFLDTGLHGFRCIISNHEEAKGMKNSKIKKCQIPTTNDLILLMGFIKKMK